MKVTVGWSKKPVGGIVSVPVKNTKTSAIVQLVLPSKIIYTKNR